MDLADAAFEVDERGDAAWALDARGLRGEGGGEGHQAPLERVGHVAVPGVVHSYDGFGAGDVEEARELAEREEAVG